MFKRKLSITDAIAVIVNLIPLFGVLLKNWDPRQLFLVYCVETIIIGGYNILKMLIVTIYKKRDKWEYNGATNMVSGFFFIIFFIFHYGLFVFIQTGIFTAVTGLAKDGDFGPLTFLRNIFSYLTMDTRIVLYFFILMYGIRMVTDFIVSGKYKEISMGMLMFQPYLRIFIQQFVVIMGSMFLAFGAGKIFMIIFVCIKIYFEVFIHYNKLIESSEKMQEIKITGRKK